MRCSCLIKIWQVDPHGEQCCLQISEYLISGLELQLCAWLLSKEIIPKSLTISILIIHLKLYIFILSGYDLIGSMMLQCVRVPGQNQGQWTGTPPQCRPRRKLHESFITAVVTYMTRIVYRYLCNYVSVCLPHSLPCIWLSTLIWEEFYI